MKKYFVLAAAAEMLLLSGCNAIGSKAASMSIAYFAAAFLSLLLFFGCIFLMKKKSIWFLVLFSSVLVVNIGYWALSVSDTVNEALWANRISYLGSVLLPYAMLMIILQVTGFQPKKRWIVCLAILAGAMFIIAASPGILTVYYQSVTLKTVSGATVLEKVYGPLHPVYLFYLLGYFGVILTATVYAIVKKRVGSPVHSAVLVGSVFINISVWLIEQLTRIDFELLSVSYIFSELFLLGLYLVLQENERLVADVKSAQTPMPPVGAPACSEEFLAGLSRLTNAEKNIYRCYAAGKSTKEILEELNITENTLKYHNRNLYGKLGVSSRKQLREMAAACENTEV